MRHSPRWRTGNPQATTDDDKALRTPRRRMGTPLPHRRYSSSPGSSRTSSGEPLSAADVRGADDHLELVDKTGLYRLRGEFRVINGGVVLGVGFEPPGRVRIDDLS
jgi:hypothetical protein